MEEAKKKDSKKLVVVIIIVIALVLVMLCCCVGGFAAMIAPKYLKYMDKVSYATDTTKVHEVFEAAALVYIDPACGVTEDFFLVEVDRNGYIKVTDASGNEINYIETELYQRVGGNRVELNSQKYTSTSSYCEYTHRLDPVSGESWSTNELCP